MYSKYLLILLYLKKFCSRVTSNYLLLHLQVLENRELIFNQNLWMALKITKSSIANTFWLFLCEYITMLAYEDWDKDKASEESKVQTLRMYLISGSCKPWPSTCMALTVSVPWQFSSWAPYSPRPSLSPLTYICIIVRIPGNVEVYLLL